MYFEPDKTLTSNDCRIESIYYAELIKEKDEVIQRLQLSLEQFDECDPQDYEIVLRIKDKILAEEESAADLYRWWDYWVMQGRWAKEREEAK